MRALLLTTLLPLAVLPSCGTDSGTDTVVVSIDTDLPTPEVATRTRIDLYTDAGSWFDSREVDTSAQNSFPLTFGIKKGAAVRVRVRIYPQGHVRPYEGERFADWPAVLQAPGQASPNRAPRLMNAGTDNTPETEPSPQVTVDRLVRIDTTQPDASPRIRLYGACAGTMANLATWESCANTARVRTKLGAPDKDLSLAPNLREACDPGASNDNVACIPGGVFVLGDHQNEIDYPPDEFLQVATVRLARVRKFWIDRQEITVGRYRAAVARGFKPKQLEPAENEGPFKPTPTKPTACTYSAKPRGREDYALSCAAFGTLRALCQFEGGDLPTEAQWEYVARAAGGVSPRRYPWGNELPSCGGVLFGRVQDFGCQKDPWPLELSVRDASGNPAWPLDRTPLDVYGLGGGLLEFVQDSVAEYTDPCFSDAPWDAITCSGPDPDPGATDASIRRTARGGSWISPPNFTRTTGRVKAALASPFTGARCAYPTRP